MAAPGTFSIQRDPGGLHIALRLEDERGGIVALADPCAARQMAERLVKLADQIETEKEARWQDLAKHQAN
jgi:hypothetical protein